jgi:hypothetical protein
MGWGSEKGRGTGRLRRILALGLSQASVLCVLCWAAVFRSYSSLAFLWTLALALGGLFVFLILARLVRPEPTEAEWN